MPIGRFLISKSLGGNRVILVVRRYSDTLHAVADAFFELSYLLIAAAGWSESDWVPTASPSDEILFLALPALIGLFVYLSLQRTAEILIAGLRFAIRDLLLLSLYVALLIACFTLLDQRFG